ncbi:MAG: hypothetical protein ACI9XR_000739 [Flavobacterium sp.]|jgi:hypothetical protein
MKNCYNLITISLVLFFSSCKVEKTAQTQNFNNSNPTAIVLNRSNWIEIGNIKNGVPKIIGDKEALLKSWNYNLSKFSRIKGNFNELSIEKANDGYLLIFRGKNYQSSFYAKAIDSNKLIALGSTACTVSRNANSNSGCIVLYDQGEPGYCSPCENAEKCTKTISSNSMISFDFKES